MDVQNIYRELIDRNLNPKKIFDSGADELRIKMKSKWLEQNLAENFSNIYSDSAEKGGLIENITLIENDETGERTNFSIGLYNKYMGQFTAICPEIIGCLSQGMSKEEALNNLCIAITECTILNFEILKIHPFTIHPVLLKFHAINSDFTGLSFDIAYSLYMEYGIKNVYLSNHNIIMKHPDYPSLTFAFPIFSLNYITQTMLRKIAQQYIGQL